MWLKEQGYACIVDPDKPTQEFSTTTCAHCQRITHIKAGQRPEDIGGFCYQCSSMICARCVGKECSPFMKKIEAMEQRDYLRQQWGKL